MELPFDVPNGAFRSGDVAESRSGRDSRRTCDVFGPWQVKITKSQPHHRITIG